MLLSMAPSNMLPWLTVNGYVPFVLFMLVAFGIVFEFPLVAYALARVGLLSAERMRRARPYAVVIMFLVAAMMTPPDVFTQISMAIPLVVFYELTIWAVRISERRRAKALATLDQYGDEDWDNEGDIYENEIDDEE